MLEKLLRRQKGIADRQQLLAGGVTLEALRWKVQTGRWRRILPAVYATFSGTLTRPQELIAAQLHGGPDAHLTGLTALEIYGLRYSRRERQIQLVVPHARRIGSNGFVTIIRTSRVEQHPRRNGDLRLVSPARAATDAARSEHSLREVRAVFAEIVQTGLTSISHLEREVLLGPRAGSGRLRVAIDELSAGVRSAPEAELRALARKSKILPPLRWNPALIDSAGKRLPTPDGYLDASRIALEVDSKAHHTSPVDWECTMRRHNLLAQHGILVLHFSPTRIRQEPQSVLAEIERAHLRRLA